MIIVIMIIMIIILLSIIVSPPPQRGNDEVPGIHVISPYDTEAYMSSFMRVEIDPPSRLITHCLLLPKLVCSVYQGGIIEGGYDPNGSRIRQVNK